MKTYRPKNVEFTVTTDNSEMPLILGEFKNEADLQDFLKSGEPVFQPGG